jgi:hypothetical protein
MVVTPASWRGLVRERLRLIDWRTASADVSPFVEPGFNLGLLTLANLEGLLHT